MAIERVDYESDEAYQNALQGEEYAYRQEQAAREAEQEAAEQEAARCSQIPSDLPF